MITLPEHVQRLSRALRCATISEADRPEANADAFAQLEALIEESFPNASALRVADDPPEGGLLWAWPGARAELAPGVLLAHHDVVPAAEATLPRWSCPPFSGDVKDGFIWGRGALDNKSNLFAMLEAIEDALKRGARPERTLYLYSGADEEVLGLRGARNAAAWFARKNIRASFVLDEGLVVSTGLAPGVDKPAALIGLAEKGYATFTITARVKDEGHSSMPTRRSVATKLAAAIERCERLAFPPRLTGLPRRMLESLAPHMSSPLRHISKNLSLLAPIVLPIMARNDEMRAQLHTTVALTRFRSGDRENAIPAEAQAVVNCRIPPGESVASVSSRLRTLLGPEIDVAEPETPIEPSKTASDQSDAYRAICASIRSVHPEAAIAPGLFPGHTDAIWFEDVADNIYRFSPLHLRPGDPARIHGVDERISIDDYGDMIAFYRSILETAFGPKRAAGGGGEQAPGP